VLVAYDQAHATALEELQTVSLAVETRHASKWAAILLAAGIGIASRLRVSHMGRTMRVPGPLHYGVHVALFALLTILCLRSTSSRRLGWLLFLAILLLGYGTEFYEHLRDTYPVESPDVLADTLGACFAMITWLCWLGWLQLRKPRRRKPVYPSP